MPSYNQIEKLYKSQQLIKENEKSAKTLILEDLQGNILKHHGRYQMCLLSIQFFAESETLSKSWIRQFASNKLGSALDQIKQAKAFKEKRIDSGTIYGFYLSHSGFIKLNISKDHIPKDSSYKSGMQSAKTAALLNDPPLRKWEEGLKKKADALILIADSDAIRLFHKKQELIHSLHGIASVNHTQQCIKLIDDHGRPIEHFGYIDGISQPFFFEKDLKKVGSTQHWDPSASLDLVLTQVSKKIFGSYLVYRKLDQDVKSFKEAEGNLGKQLFGKEDEISGALVVGRFENGVAITLSNDEDYPKGHSNDFNYDQDEDGSKCPFFAHVRKVNDRKDKSARIVRRGMPYDEAKRQNNLNKLPSKNVGLAFLSFQASIAQFENMQIAANSDKGGVDPIIGQHHDKKTKQECPITWGSSKNNKTINFKNFVTLKGGEYYFSPNLSFLRELE